MNVSDLIRLISNLLRVGFVAEIDLDAPRVRVQTGDNLTDWIDWKVQRAGTSLTWDPPTEGEQVLLVCPEGELAGAIVLMSLYSDDHAAPSNSPNKHLRLYPDGARIEYDFSTGALTATGIKTARVQASVSTEFDCPLTTFKGKVVVEDLLSYQAGMSGKNSKGNKTEVEGDFIQKNGEMSSNGIVVDKHHHDKVMEGGAISGGPVA